jgi:hypothetical protein
MSRLKANNDYRTMTREEVAHELRWLASELESEARIPYAAGAVAVPQDLIDSAISSRCDDDTVYALRAISSMTYTNITQVVASASIVDIGGGDAQELHSLSAQAGDAEGADDMPGWTSAPSEGGEM